MTAEITVDPGGTPEPTEAGVEHQDFNVLVWMSEQGVFVFTALLLIFAGIFIDGFASVDNITDVFNRAAPIGIVAVGMTFVVISANYLDLSVVAQVATSAVLLIAVSNSQNMLLGMALGLLVAIVYGIVNGVAVGVFRANAVIVTLSTTFIGLGLLRWRSGGSIYFGDPDGVIATFGKTEIGPFPLAMLVLIVVTLAMHLVLTKTTFGFLVKSFGSNREATRLAGVNTPLVVIGAFTVSALGALLGGWVLAAFSNTAVSSMSDGFDFEALAAIIVGGTSVFGGKGSVLRTLLGVVFVSALTNIMVLSGYGFGYQQMAIGALIVLAVSVDALAEGGEFMTNIATLELGNEQQDLIGRVKTTFARRTEGRAVILLILVLIWAFIWESTVFTAYEVTLGRLALIGLTAVGLTAVILMGELDLSIASILAVSGVVMASFDNVAVGIIVALSIGLVIGAVNAFFVVVVGINSFIATLGMLFFLRGMAFVISDEEPVVMANKDFALDFGKPLIGEFTPRVLIFILAFIAMQIFLTRVRVGREFYAVGGNREAARDAGVPVRRRVFTGFMISGFVAAAAGIIVTLQLTAADPTAGGDALLTSFAAAIVGGILLTGGRGSVVGTLLGAASLAILQVGMTFNGVESDVQNIIIGLVLFVAVITDPNSIRAVVGSARAFLRSRSAPDAAG